MRIYKSISSNEIMKNPYQKSLAKKVMCSAPAGAAGETGEMGPTGLNAYEIAVENGFIGSEQEWLNSLVGPTGPAGISKSIIPYFVKDFTGFAYPEGGGMLHSLSVFGFGDFYSEIFADQLGPPQTFTISADTGEGGAAFSSAFDLKITSIAFSSMGAGELPIEMVLIKIAVFLSPEGSNVFTIDSSSILTLLPPINESTSPFNVDGAKELNISVPAGTKIAVAAYLDSYDDIEIFMDIFCFLSGSISIETN